MSVQVGERLKRNTTAVEVANVLRKRILSGVYEEAHFIRQELIAQELGVSRIPVREALAQLEAEGLVVWEKYRGAVVPKMSLAEIKEIYELRGMLEPYLLEHAIDNITDAHLERLWAIIDRSNAAENLQDWAGLNVDFHKTLYEAAQKPLAIQTLDNLINRADRYLKMQRFLSQQTQKESNEQHRRILELVSERNRSGALDVLREHISWNEHDVVDTVGLAGSGDS